MKATLTSPNPAGRVSATRPATGWRGRLAAGALFVTATGLVTGGGGVRTAAYGAGAAAAATPAASGLRAMVIVSVATEGITPSTLALHAGQPVMLMILNGTPTPRHLHSAMPITGLQLDNVGANQGRSNATGIDVTVAAGGEVDLTFTPTVTGQYDLGDDVDPAGALIVS